MRQKGTIMCALPTSKQEAKGEYTPLDAGTYQARLKSIDLDINSEFKTENFNDGKGLRFQGCTLTWDLDGDEYREMFVKVSTHEKAKFYNRISSLLGRDLTNEDEIDWRLSPQARTDATIDEYWKPDENIYQSAEDEEKTTTDVDEAARDDKGEPIIVHKKKEWVYKGSRDDGVIGHVDDLLINGESLIGKECLLVLKVNEKGYNRSDAGAGSPLPKSRAKKPAGAPN